MSTRLSWLATLSCLLAAAAGRVLGGPVVSWPSLEAEPDRRGGLFAAWSVGQRKLLDALHAVERADPDRDIHELQRRLAEDPTDLAAGEALAVRCWRKGQLHDAVDQFRRVLALAPSRASARLRLAELFREIGAPDLAVRELAEGVRLAPSSVPLRAALAELLAALGRHKQAAEAWREVVGTRPTDLAAQLSLARALALAGQQEAAKTVLARASEAGALSPAKGEPELLLDLADAYRFLGQWSAASGIWSGILKRRPHPAALAQAGLLHLREADYKAAREAFERAIELPGPPPPIALAGAAVAAHALGDDEAVIQLSRRLRGAPNPESPESGEYSRDAHDSRFAGPRLAATLLADLWLARDDRAAIEAVWAAVPGERQRMLDAYGQFRAATRDAAAKRRELALLLSLAALFREADWVNAAIDPLEAARKIARGSVALGLALADAYAATGQDERELALLEALTRDEPDSVIACQRLVRAYIQRRRWADAEEVNRTFSKRFFDELESRITAAELAIRKGNYEAAVADCRAAMNKNPLDPRPYALVLDALLRAGKLSEATAAIRGREGADPTFVPGPLEEAVLALAEGRPDDALAQARRGIRASPLDHRLWLLAAAVLERKGDLPAAAASCEVASWLQPGSIATRLAFARAAARAVPSCEPSESGDDSRDAHDSRVALSGLAALAAEAYREAIKLGDDSLDLRVEFADALDAWGRPDEAIALLTPIEATTAADRDKVSVRLAEALLANRQPLRALELARALLAKDPLNPVARRAAVLACRDLGDLAAAIAVCEASAKVAPVAKPDADLGLLYLLAGRYKEASERLAAATASTEERAQRAELFKAQAAALIAQGLGAEADAALDDARSALAPDATPGDDLVLASALAGGEAKARPLLARLEKGSPTRAGWLRTAAARLAANRQTAALVLPACAASAAGWHGRAAELLDAAVKKAPTEPLLLYQCAREYASAGKPDAALVPAQALAAACPKAGDAHFLVASLLDAQGKSDAAVVAYARAVPLLDASATAQRLAAAERLAAAGKPDPAIEALRAVVAAEPGNLAVGQKLAWLLAAHKPDRLAEAEALASAAAKGRPNDPACRDTLGWVLFLAKKPDAARPEVLAAIALQPQEALFYYHLGMIDLVRGRRELARRALRIALELDPKLPDADTARSTLKTLDAGAAPDGARPPAP